MLQGWGGVSSCVDSRGILNDILLAIFLLSSVDTASRRVKGASFGIFNSNIPS